MFVFKENINNWILALDTNTAKHSISLIVSIKFWALHYIKVLEPEQKKLKVQELNEYWKKKTTEI